MLFSQNIRQQIQQNLLSAQDFYRQAREKSHAFFERAQKEAAIHGIELDEVPLVVDVGENTSRFSNSFLRRQVQMAGAVFALGMVVSGVSALLLGFLQLLLAFLLVTRVLGVRVDLGAVAS